MKKFLPFYILIGMWVAMAIVDMILSRWGAAARDFTIIFLGLAFRSVLKDNYSLRENLRTVRMNFSAMLSRVQKAQTDLSNVTSRVLQLQREANRQYESVVTVWIARDKRDNSALLFSEKPFFTGIYWDCSSNGECALLINKMDVFPNLTFEDSPQKVELRLIKEK